MNAVGVFNHVVNHVFVCLRILIPGVCGLLKGGVRSRIDPLKFLVLF